MSNLRAVYQCLRALANERRLRIVLALAQRAHSVAELGALLDCSETATSQHLQKLRTCGMVRRAQRGMEAEYTLVRTEPFIRVVLPMLQR